MDTLIVNLYGAPGAGKSTGAAYVFAMLKSKGINAELVTEFAKDKTWENSIEVLKNQAYVFGEQYARIMRLVGKVDVIVTDSPILLSLVYNSTEPKESFNNYVLSLDRQLNNINYYLVRTKKYLQVGRNQSEDEASSIGSDIIKMLNTYDIRYTQLTGRIEDYDKIVDDVIDHIRPAQKTVCNKCGKEFDLWDAQEDFTIEGVLGYGTKYDGDKLKIHLCCDCMEKLIDECVVSPIFDNT